MVTLLMLAGISYAETRQDYLLDALEASGEKGISLAPGIDVGVVLEVEGSYMRQGDKDTSDITLATFELGLDAALMPGVGATVALLWEEDDTEPMDLDVGYINLGGTEQIPVVLSAGKMYVPFGTYNSMMLSDPMTLELGETRETAVSLLYEQELFTAWVGAFSGNLNTASKVNNAVAALAVTPIENLTFGVSYITDLGESDGLTDGINEVLDSDGKYSDAGGYTAVVAVDLDPVFVEAEYVGAAGDLKLTDTTGEQTKTSPQAWNVEAGYAFADGWMGALRYEASKEFSPEEMPENQYGATVAYEINSYTTISAEYMYGTYKPSGTDSRHLGTAQLALAF